MRTIDQTTSKAKRGFAAMDSEKQREIARRGGKSVPPERRSFAQSRELAATAGRTGGKATQAGRQTDRH